MRALVPLIAIAITAPAAAQQTGADAARVYDLSEVEVLPRVQNPEEFTTALERVSPRHLRNRNVHGTVQVEFVVGADGQPRDVRVLGTPDAALAVASSRAVSVFRFAPAQVGGQPVAVRVEQRILWSFSRTPRRMLARDDSRGRRGRDGESRETNPAIWNLRGTAPAAETRPRFGEPPPPPQP